MCRSGSITWTRGCRSSTNRSGIRLRSRRCRSADRIRPIGLNAVVGRRVRQRRHAVRQQAVTPHPGVDAGDRRRRSDLPDESRCSTCRSAPTSCRFPRSRGSCPRSLVCGCSRRSSFTSADRPIGSRVGLNVAFLGRPDDRRRGRRSRRTRPVGGRRRLGPPSGSCAHPEQTRPEERHHRRRPCGSAHRRRRPI